MRNFFFNIFNFENNKRFYAYKFLSSSGVNIAPINLKVFSNLSNFEQKDYNVVYLPYKFDSKDFFYSTFSYQYFFSKWSKYNFKRTYNFYFRNPSIFPNFTSSFYPFTSTKLKITKSLFFRKRSRTFIVSSGRPFWGSKIITKYFAYKIKNISKFNFLKKKKKLFFPLSKFSSFKVIFTKRGRKKYYKKNYNFSKVQQINDFNKYYKSKKLFYKFKRPKFHFIRSYRFKLFKFFKFQRIKVGFRYKNSAKRRIYFYKKYFNKTFYNFFFNYFNYRIKIKNEKKIKAFIFFSRKKIRFYRFKKLYKFFKKKQKLKYRVFKNFTSVISKNSKFKNFLYKNFFPVLFNNSNLNSSNFTSSSKLNSDKIIKFSRLALFENFCSTIFTERNSDFFSKRFKLIKFVQFFKFFNYSGYPSASFNIQKVFYKLISIISFDIKNKTSVDSFKHIFSSMDSSFSKFGNKSSRLYFSRFKFISAYKKRFFIKFFRFITFSNIFSKLLAFNRNTKFFYRTKKCIIRFLISYTFNGKFIYFFPFFYFKRQYYSIISHLNNNIYVRSHSAIFYISFSNNRRKHMFSYSSI